VSFVADRVNAEYAPAKINLHLHVVGRRADGYHLLDSLVVFAGIGDRLTVSTADRLTLSVTGPFAAGLAGEPDNLVLKAAHTLAARAGLQATGALVLEKNLPVASGIGGGSADAAAGSGTWIRACWASLRAAWGRMCRCVWPVPRR
jgi:4-diphosphocytidyl-2-C-methyl-D-erythritol kinase